MSTIIKKDRLAEGAATPQPIVYQFVDVSDQAHNYLTQIKAKAVSIVDQAQQDAEDIRKQAVYEGQQAADQLAERKAEQGLQSHLSTLLPALQEVEQQLRTVRDQWLKHWECQVVHLATTIAERIIRREVSLQPEITVDLVREALELATGRQQIKVRLNPHDYETLKGQLYQWTLEIDCLDPDNIIADPDIEIGSCRVDTKFGTIDQQFSSQLSRIEEELSS